MRLLEHLPHPPRGEGSFWAYNSGGEQAAQFNGKQHMYNELRRELQLDDATHKGHTLEDISLQEMAFMLSSDKYEVVYVYHEGADSREAMKMAGGAIARRKRVGDYASRVTVKELVVAPDVRQQHIASYMLGNVTQNLLPTEMVVDTTTFVVEPWFKEKLTEAGFHHNAKNGAPALWLPGRKGSAHSNLESSATVNAALQHMPNNWNGYWEFYPQTDPQFHIFREGTLVGVVRPIEGTRTYDDVSMRRPVFDFVLSDAGGAELGIVKGLTEKEAVTALLNNFELLETIENS